MPTTTTKIVDVEVGVGHALALASDRSTLYAWGSNTNTLTSGTGGGQLGTGNEDIYRKPVKVITNGALAGQSPYGSIAAGAYASFALGDTGKVFSWGSSGNNGLLGNGASGAVSTTVPALGPWFGDLTGVQFGNKYLPASQITAAAGKDWTTLNFQAPAYDGSIAGSDAVDVDVTTRFKLMGGNTDTGQTASWPAVNYRYYGTPELTWAGDPTAEVSGDGRFVSGATATFVFSGVASGETGFADTAFVQEDFTGAAAAPSMVCAPASVSAGESFTCTGTYRLTAADIRAGRVLLTGKLSATYDGEKVEVDAARTATLSGIPEGELLLKKTVTSPTSFVADEVATYKFVIENIGDADVHNISVVETEFEGTSSNLGELTCTKGGAPIDYPIASTQLGDRVECVADYTLTQADIDRGSVKNTAQARGVVLPGDENETEVISNSSSAEAKGERSPSLSLKVYSNFDAEDLQWAAETSFKYQFQTVNDGPTTAVVDSVAKDSFNGTGSLGAITCAPQLPATLAPGEVVNCQADYTLGQVPWSGVTVS